MCVFLLLKNECLFKMQKRKPNERTLDNINKNLNSKQNI